MKMTSDSKKVSILLKQAMADEFGPKLELVETETYDFPEGTRVISIFTPMSNFLLITKVGSEYKIISAMHEALD